MNTSNASPPSRSHAPRARPAPYFHPEFGSAPTSGSALPTALIDAVRARVPQRPCAHCGESIGAARLTLHPETAICA